MQDTCHIIVNGQKIKLLRRLVKSRYWHCVKLKIRQSGRDGPYLPDESEWFAEYPSAFIELKAGRVITT